MRARGMLWRERKGILWYHSITLCILIIIFIQSLFQMSCFPHSNLHVFQTRQKSSITKINQQSLLALQFLMEAHNIRQAQRLYEFLANLQFIDQIQSQVWVPGLPEQDICIWDVAVNLLVGFKVQYSWKACQSQKNGQGNIKLIIQITVSNRAASSSQRLEKLKIWMPAGYVKICCFSQHPSLGHVLIGLSQKVVVFLSTQWSMSCRPKGSSSTLRKLAL